MEITEVAVMVGTEVAVMESMMAAVLVEGM